jgi:hypothetical protein
MDIKIGGGTLRTRKPGDLDAALIAATGCSAAETAKQLAGWPSAGRIASALRPFLPDDAPSTPELAHSIASAEDGPEVLVAVKTLYADAATAGATTAPAASGDARG